MDHYHGINSASPTSNHDAIDAEYVLGRKDDRGRRRRREYTSSPYEIINHVIKA
jgi:hypothetical protein